MENIEMNPPSLAKMCHTIVQSNDQDIVKPLDNEQQQEQQQEPNNPNPVIAGGSFENSSEPSPIPIDNVDYESLQKEEEKKEETSESETDLSDDSGHSSDDERIKMSLANLQRMYNVVLTEIIALKRTELSSSEDGDGDGDEDKEEDVMQESNKKDDDEDKEEDVMQESKRKDDDEIEKIQN